MGTLECNDLATSFGSWRGQFSCTFAEGDWHVLCGGSGSGKSTLFQLMLGLQKPSAGAVIDNGRNLVGLAPHLRSMSFMAQFNILLPHLNIQENLELVLHDLKLTKSERSQRIEEITSLIKLDHTHLRRRPIELSGGQLSRCNFARCLLRPARWVLLDEPFAAVDRPTRIAILDWLKAWQNRTKVGILLVSHDLDDIFNVASHVTVIRSGRVIESQPLEAAISRPICATTAELLRSGIVIRQGHANFFVNAADLSLSRAINEAHPEEIDEFPLTNPKTTRIGHCLRITDLNMGIDVTVAASTEFRGSLWFNRLKKCPLKED